LVTQVYAIEEIKLQTGETYSFKPFNIKLQKKFMKKWDELGKVENEEESIDQMMVLAKICIESVDKELAEDDDKLEEALDMPTIYKLIEICAGIKLNDPNLMAAAAQATMAMETAGKS
jgi:hypothetical protein